MKNLEISIKKEDKDIKNINYNYYQTNSKEYIEISKTFNMNEFYNFTESIITNNNFKTILDVGFGSARDMLYFKSKDYNIVGVDFCENFVKNAIVNGLEAYQEVLPNFKNIPKNYNFDLIYSVAMIFHLDKKDRIKLFNNLQKKLNDNGIIILSYTTQNRKNHKDRIFKPLTNKEIEKEINMIKLDEINIVDKLGTSWCVVSFKKR